MITNKEVTKFLIDTVATDPEIEKYCQVVYQQSIKLYVGANTEDPPSKKDMPLALFEPLHKSIGESESHFEYEMFLRIAVPGLPDPIIDEEKNLVTYSGIYEVEDLGNIIVERIKEEISCKTNLETYEVSFFNDEINSFPIYTGTIILSFNTPQLLGEEQFKLLV